MKLAGAIYAIAWIGTSLLAAEPQSLAEVQEFAFGGVGVAGIESQGERFFRDVMGRDDAVASFKKILGNGTPAGKLYALCGIRMLASKDFSSAAEPLLKSKETVTTMRGCMVAKEPVATVAQQISQGSFDISLNNPRRPNQKLNEIPPRKR